MIAVANFLTLLWFGTLWGENRSPENHHTKGAIPVEERKRLGSKRYAMGLEDCTEVYQAAYDRYPAR